MGAGCGTIMVPGAPAEREENKMKANGIKAAWKIVDELTTSDYMYDAARSQRAGYSVYTSTRKGCDEYVCDLGTRLEVNLEDGRSINIWIEQPVAEEYQLDDALKVINNAIYEIDDNVLGELATITGIAEARVKLYGAYAEIKKILDDFYPSSNLYRKYNLTEA